MTSAVALHVAMDFSSLQTEYARVYQIIVCLLHQQAFAVSALQASVSKMAFVLDQYKTALTTKATHAFCVIPISNLLTDNATNYQTTVLS